MTTARLTLVGDYNADDFAAASDGAGGTTITYTGSANAALRSKLHQFSAAIAAHSADAASGAAVHSSPDRVQRPVLAAAVQQ